MDKKKTIDETELKKEIKALRVEINKRNKQIKEIYDQMGFHRKEANTLRAMRDNTNEKKKTLQEQTKELISERNKFTKKILELKKKRRTLIEKVKELSRGVQEKKVERDDLNKIAKGKFESLYGGYEERYKKLSKKGIPLKDEIKLFEKIFEIKERLMTAKDADEKHKEIINSYEETKKLNKKIDKISKKIKTLADKSQEKHEEAVKIFREIDKLREEGNEYHLKLLERYETMRPFREKINKLKEEIKTLREKLAPLNEEVRKLKAMREERKKEEILAEMKKKVQGKKRFSIEDFKLLLEKGEIKLGGR
jgi:uncharacterized coiled-coil DUF342 family protein